MNITNQSPPRWLSFNTLNARLVITVAIKLQLASVSFIIVLIDVLRWILSSFPAQYCTFTYFQVVKFVLWFSSCHATKIIKSISNGQINYLNNFLNILRHLLDRLNNLALL